MHQVFDCLVAIRQSGFDGFATIRDLQSSGCCNVPDKPGVYFVVRASESRPEFLEASSGGHFKGRNPVVPVGLLEDKWVEYAIVLYIGKAGPRRTLKARLNQYMRFGQGAPIGHWGGRYIWQLNGSGELRVCWKTTPDADPRVEESDLINQFQATYDKLPFANCVR